jgi:hypothetical protein
VAVLGCSPLHAPREFPLSRGSRSSIHRESERSSRNSFTTSVPNRTAPNHALQRTAPARHAGCCTPSRHLRPSCPRPRFRSQRAAPPQSLSLGSFGDLHAPSSLIGFFIGYVC